MQVTIRTFAILRELSADRTVLELPPGARLEEAWAAMTERYPELAAHRAFVRAARAGAYAKWDTPLVGGDEVAFLPPVSGGSTMTLTDEPIDVTALEAALSRPAHGAVVTFIGRARETADDGRRVLELEYEVYPEMASAVLSEITTEAESRWGAAVAVVHRTGIVPIGEAAVAIVTAAPHRAEAYEANRYVIEANKERLPIWKRERYADGTEWKRPGA